METEAPVVVDEPAEEIHSQNRCLLFSLPFEIREQIWTLYYSGQNTASVIWRYSKDKVRRYHTEDELLADADSHRGEMVIEYDPHRGSLQRTCRKMDHDTRQVRKAWSSWTLKFPSTGLADFVKVLLPLGQSELSGVLHKVVKMHITIRQTTINRRIPDSGEFWGVWLILANRFPALKNVEIVYRRQMHGDTHPKSHEQFTTHVCYDGGDRLLRRRFFDGEYDERFRQYVVHFLLRFLANKLGSDAQVRLTYFMEPSQHVLDLWYSPDEDHPRNSITFLIRSGEDELTLVSRYWRCFHRTGNLWKTCGYLDQCTEREAYPQSQSMLLSLPREVRHKIWTIYYADQKVARAAVCDGVKIGDHDCQNLRLTCRKLDRDAREICKAAA